MFGDKPMNSYFIRRLYHRIRTSGIRRVPESPHLVWCRLWLRVRYGYGTHARTMWGAYKWTRVKAMAELADAMWSLLEG